MSRAGNRARAVADRVARRARSLASALDGSGRMLATLAIATALSARRRSAPAPAPRAKGRGSARDLLAELAALLAGSLDYPATLAAVAALPVPALADHASVWALDEHGRPRLGATSPAPPGREEAARALRERWERSPPEAVARAIASGRAERLELADEGLRSLGLRACFVAPLVARGRRLGALLLLAAGDRPRFREPELALARAVAERAAIAIDNARLLRDAQSAVRSRDEVLAVVSHDLKNPLNVIRLASELLERSLSTQRLLPLRRQAQRITRATRTMERMVRDLLDAASVQGGAIALQRRPHEAGRLAAEALDAVATLAAAKRLRLLVEPSPAARAICDRDRVLQVLNNLLANAIRFAPEGGTVALGWSHEGEVVVFAVRDNGPGVPAEIRDHLFERFRRAGDAHGTGLGLYIARGLVEAHGGRIWAESEPGAGSTFRFSLPAARPLAAAEPQPIAWRPPLVERRAREASRRLLVLVAEQRDDVGEGIEMMLERDGHLAVRARDGLQALRLLDRLYPDLLLLELVVPRLDGFEVLRRLAGRRDGPRVIATSAMRAFLPEAARLGAATTLAKPFGLEQLRAACARALLPPVAPPEPTLAGEACPVDERPIAPHPPLHLEEPRAELDALARLAAEVLRAPIALVSIVTPDRRCWKAMHGVDEALARGHGERGEDAFSAHAVAARAALVVSDARSHPVFRESPLVRERVFRAYAGVPIELPRVGALGTLCVLDRRPRHFTCADVELLALLADRVAAELAWIERERLGELPPGALRYPSLVDERHHICTERALRSLAGVAARVALVEARSLSLAGFARAAQGGGGIEPIVRALGAAPGCKRLVGRLGDRAVAALLVDCDRAGAQQLVDETLAEDHRLRRTEPALAGAPPLRGVAIAVAAGCHADSALDALRVRLDAA